MDTIFMNSENSRTLLLYQIFIALSNLSIYYAWRNIKSSYKNNKFKISAPSWSDEFELPDGSHSVSEFKIILNIFLKNIVKVLMTHQFKFL